MHNKYIILDFDETLYSKDSLIHFHLFCLRKNPFLACWIPFQILAYLLHSVKIISTQQFKNCYLLFLAFQSPQQILKKAEAFWQREYPTFFQAELLTLIQQSQEHVVIITASPVLYIQPLMDKLPGRMLIGTNLKRKGVFYLIDGHNCKGVEKVIRFTQQFGENTIVTKSFSDNLSDAPILSIAQQGFLVKGKKIIPYRKLP